METTLSSMTGFGAGEAPWQGRLVRVELRAVNHRSLDIRVRTANELADWAAVVEDVLRAACVRGRIDAQVRVSHEASAVLDIARYRTAYLALCKLRDELAPGQEVPFTSVLQLPVASGGAPDQDDRATEDAIRAASRLATDALHHMRVREGAALARDLRARLANLRAIAATIAADRPAQIEHYRERVLTRVRKMLEGSGIDLDSARLAQEVAWMAERSDVAEELTRLASHLDQFESALAQHDGSVGRKLEFLVQEMGREANTLGSKSSDASQAHRVVEMKAELDRIREQVANVL